MNEDRYFIMFFPIMHIMFYQCKAQRGVVMSNKWVTKQTLLIRAQNQDDSQAWEDFVDYYRDFIKILIYRLNISSNDVDDLSQEILLKIWKNLEKYDPERNKFRTWLNCLIRNKVIDFIRKKSRIKKLEVFSTDEDEEEINLSLSESEMEDLIDKEWRTYLTNRAMKNIEPLFSGQAIEVFQLTLDSVPVIEIANRLNITEGSVYTLRKRVKQRLKAEIKRLKEDIEF